jgi:hypothetical protein
MAVPEAIQSLVDKYAFHRDAYLRGQEKYNEIQLRQDLNKRLQDAKLDHERTLLSRHVEATDGEIDKLVYELYGLTEEEIKIVVGTQNAK